MAGVSRQTVSRVLNDHPSVTSATRTRVSDAITGVGYVVNNGARSLRSGRARMIAIFVLPDAEKTGARLLPLLEATIREAGSWSIVRFLDSRDDLDGLVLESTGAVADGAIIVRPARGVCAGGETSSGRRVAADLHSVDAFVRELADGDNAPRPATSTTLIVQIDPDAAGLIDDHVATEHPHLSSLPQLRKT